MSTSPCVVLIRPGETEMDQQRRVSGSLDLPLTEPGKASLQAISAELPSLGIQAWYCGPSLACRLTAAILSPGGKVACLEDFRNQHLGLWEGLTIDELRRKAGKRCRVKGHEIDFSQPPEGETLEEVVPRLQRWVRDWTRRPRTVAIVMPDPVASYLGALLMDQDPFATGLADVIHPGRMDVVIPVVGDSRVKSTVSQPHFLSGLWPRNLLGRALPR